MAFTKDLKFKLKEIDSRLIELSSEASLLVIQKEAIEKVLRFYDPGYDPVKIKAPKALVIETTRHIAAEGTPTRRVTEIMKDISNLDAAYKSLAALGRPATSTEVAKAFAKEKNVLDEWEKIGAALTSRLSAALSRLNKAGKIRIAGSIGGFKHTWEISKP